MSILQINREKIHSVYTYLTNIYKYVNRYSKIDQSIYKFYKYISRSDRIIIKEIK